LNHQLVALNSATATDEVTVYVKGFLARGEKAESFEAWLAGHEAMADSHGWSRAALGYHWESGDLRKLALPIAGGVKTAWDIYRLVRHTRRIAPLATAGWFLAEQGAALSARFVTQFIEARRHSSARADDLAACLQALAQQHERVRVIGHSLGCRQVIEASSLLLAAERPDEIHLFAPACLESEVGDKLEDLAREHAYLYFTGLDHVLDISFRAMTQGRAIGAVGLERDYAGLTSRDVSSEFDFWVHTEYKNRFSRFTSRSSERIENEATHHDELP
jgi:hypothetical protein